MSKPGGEFDIAALRVIANAALAYGLSGVMASTIAQNFPGKPIRIVTAEVGGGSDFVARMLAQGLGSSFGEPVIVDNRGGGGSISGEIVAQAPADGYTLLIGAGTLWIGPLLRKTAFDILKDFAAISLVVSTPNILVVHPSVPSTSVRELIALAKSKPGTLNFATGPTGSANHLAAELFKSMASINIVRIPYRGGGPALNGVLGGEVQLMFPSAASASPSVKSGKLKALGISSAEQSSLFPGLTTISAAGVPGYESATLTGMFAPAKTPAAIVMLLNSEVVHFLRLPETVERFLRSADSDVVGSSPEQLSEKIRSEVARLGKVIKDAGIVAERL